MTFETSEIMLLRSAPIPLAAGRCVQCAEPSAVAALTPEEAALFAHVTPRTVYRWVEQGLVHFTETPEGLLHICSQSVAHQGSLPPRRESRLRRLCGLLRTSHISLATLRKK